jgi:hypothetical protein
MTGSQVSPVQGLNDAGKIEDTSEFHCEEQKTREDEHVDQDRG